MTKNISQKLQIIMFFAIVAAAYLIGNGALPLLGPDEPRYAQVAREMFERNDWITPTLGGFHWFEKPALAYWLMIVGYNLFGVNEFAARFGSALFGVLTILTIYWLAKFISEKISNDEQQTTNNFPLWALLTSASSVGLLIFSHAATFDVILTFPVAAALALFFAAQNSESNRKNLLLAGFYFFTGLGLLAKGLVGAVLPFGIIFCYFAARRRFPDKSFLLSLIWGGLIALATAAAWYLPMYWRHGWTFVDEFFIQHHFARYTSNKYQHPEPFWFFWAVLPGLTLPWLPFLFAEIRQIFKSQHPTPNTQRPNVSPFLFSWLLMPVVFFSFSGSKLPGYILPALPAALILAALSVWRIAEKNKVYHRGLQFLAWTVLGICAVLPFLLGNADFTRRDTAKYLLESASNSDAKVLGLHDVWHSLEFYAAGRLVRDEKGRQIKFEGIGEIAEWMNRETQNEVLVVVPLEYEKQLLETRILSAEKRSDNGAFALFVVRRQ